MGRLAEIFAEDNAQGGSESISLEERVTKMEEMLVKLTDALIGSTEDTVEETETKEETVETETTERKDDEE